MSVRTLALGAMMLVGAAGVAAAQSTTAPQTRPDSGMYRRGPRAGGEFHGRKGGRGFGADLNLTDAQKTQIKAIRDKYKTQFQALRTQQKPLIDAARAARQKGDTAAFRSNMQQARQLAQPLRTQEMNEIRNVLTPDQRAKFDARQKEMADRHGKWGKKGGKGLKKTAAPQAKS
ncbi:MAG TPA: Spy/CpxP family protein refolding chaperone [Gemmatimonadaceae bacterium]|nr:Spy/CpxP family protein refolding chaperone [Gemmatimonadaceae bacterium]